MPVGKNDEEKMARIVRVEHLEGNCAPVPVTVWNKKWTVLKGFHTMAAQYVGGQFVVYNYYMQYTSAYYATSIDALDADSGWLYGYIVGG